MENIKIRYGMVIDQRRCTGCHACAIACMSENNMPKKLVLNAIMVENSEEVDIPGTRWTALTDKCTMDVFNRVPGTPRKDFRTRACQHCDEAPCVPVCPTKATWKREDGIVDMDTSLCIGCDICMQECPYGLGVMRVHVQEPQFSMDFEAGDPDAEPTEDNTVKKCTFCSHRIDRGEEPFCVSQCPSRARYFGDLNDAGSKVGQLIRTRDYVQFDVEAGKTPTSPCVYFLKP